MPTLSVIAAIDVPAIRIWEAVGDFEDPSGWYPWPVDEHDGNERRVRRPDGSTVRERLVSHDAAHHTYTYRALDGLPLLGRLALESIAGGTMCLVVWSVRFESTPTEQLAVLRELEHVVMRPALRDLRAAFA
ncbi:SRPBCC family protein [Embleya sp. NBC_00888]|uniref:SRPBCC family protein n=1 Tax=Embleya sp. NBC_00888 TaxID=2975960 RepID=UPI00386679A1|nr:SRPBCC family protein [Embleya sp. NBC_00888]